MIFKPLRKKNFLEKTNKTNTSQIAIGLFSFLTIIGVVSIFFANYLATNKQVTNESQASSQMTCGYVGNSCQLVPIDSNVTNISFDSQYKCVKSNSSFVSSTSTSFVCIEEKNTDYTGKPLDGVPQFVPISGEKFADQLTVTLEYEEATEYEVVYKINNGKFQKYTDPFTINEDSIIQAKFLKDGQGGDIVIAEYKKETEKEIVDDRQLVYYCLPDNSALKVEYESSQKYDHYYVSVDQGGDGLDTVSFKTNDQEFFSDEDNFLIKNILPNINYKTVQIVPMRGFSLDLEHSFTMENILCEDQKNTTIVNIAPRFTKNDFVTIEGVTAVDFDVIINGQVMIPRSKYANWAVNFPIEKVGENEIEVSYRDSEKNESKKTIFYIDRCSPADINCDQKIDLIDISWYRFLEENDKIEKFEFQKLIADIDENGKIDNEDINLFKELYLSS